MKMKKVSKKSEADLLGKTMYLIEPTFGSGVSCGTVVKVTPKFCIIEHVSGKKKRKSKNHLYDSEDSFKLAFIKNANAYIYELFHMNMFELGKMYAEMIEKYPEQFV